MYLSLVTSAYAQGATSGAPATGMSLLGGMTPILLIMVVFFFLIIWPQQKTQKKYQKMLESLKKGDRILTRGGMYGTITSFENNDLIVKVANNVEIKIVKSGVESLVKAGSDS